MNAVLVVIFVGSWFCVFVSMTRTSRDAASANHSIDRFSTAMRTLSRRTAPPTADGRYIMVPTPAVTDRRRAATAAGVARRRRSFLRLLAAALGTLVATVVLGGPWMWIHLGIDLMLVGYLVRSRRERVREAARADRARRRARAEAARLEAERDRPAGRLVDLFPGDQPAPEPIRQPRRRAVGDGS